MRPIAIAIAVIAAASATAFTAGAQTTAASPRYVLDYEPEVIGNVYDSDFGAVTVYGWDRAGAKGRYANDGIDQGWFEGRRDPPNSSDPGVHTVRGYWYQKQATVRCSSQKGDTYYWGKIQFHFEADRGEFIGFWSACDATPLNRWNGTFSHRDERIVAAVRAQMAGMATAPSDGSTGSPAPAGSSATGNSPDGPSIARKPGAAVPGVVDRAGKTAADEAERQLQDRIREGIRRAF